MAGTSIVIPTTARLAYLEVALRSLAREAAQHGAEVLVVEDGPASPRVRVLAGRQGARHEPLGAARGLNAARNAGVERSSGDLVVFLDDDVETQPGWLGALLAAAEAHPEAEVLAGRITARLEGPAPRGCGREGSPVTALDLGGRDVPTAFAWGANMAIRRSALERVGPFDETISEGGDEQEWQERLAERDGPGRVLYVAGAHVAHRRAGADARLRSLAAGAAVRGRAARRFDARRGRAPTLRRELLTLAGCAGHVVRRRCPAGLTMLAHSTARVRQATRERLGRERPTASEDFLSGASGNVGGTGARVRAAADVALDALELGSARRARLGVAARREPPCRRVLAAMVERPERAETAAAASAELMRSRHDVRLLVTEPRGRGKFESLAELIEPEPDCDWLLVVDDDVALPNGFLDRFVFLAERFDLQLAQPAHRLVSHAAWSVTRRRPLSAVRETRFVEIGPVTGFARLTLPVLLPFPRLRMGWGLDVHWAALASAHGWRCGVLDAIPVGHTIAPAASAYGREEAVTEARRFLNGRPYLPATEAQRTLATHRRW